MKPAVVAAIAVSFVALLAGVVFFGPDLIDSVAGKPTVPAPVPFKRTDFDNTGTSTPPSAPLSASGSDAGVEPEPPPAPVLPPEESKPVKVARASPVGYLTLSTVPSGIAVLYKGQELGKTPLQKHPMPIGKQAVALDLKGKRKNLMLTVKEGKEQKLSLKWDKLK